jgi:2-C-methyl-D-erythritol 2,4-cyclodiphosphate synthase
MVEFRTGIGHDIHRLVRGKNLVLGGVLIPADVGFDTHSDGDVLCHALIDALAGAIDDGDLGTHFPEDDPDAEDARSLGFVREFAGHVKAAGFAVGNVDAFVVLGPVRLRPHLAAMRANLAEALGLDEFAVSVKARSNDGLGPEGEGTPLLGVGERSRLSQWRPLSPPWLQKGAGASIKVCAASPEVCHPLSPAATGVGASAAAPA